MPGVGEGALYKFEIVGPSGDRLPLKSDPFAFALEAPPSTGVARRRKTARSTGRTRLAEPAQSPPGTSPPDLDLRGACGLLAPRREQQLPWL